MPQSPRIELFFKNLPQLRERLTLLGSEYAVNIVNKDSNDDLLKWISQCKNLETCVHYSLKFQKVKRGTVEQHFSKLLSFLQSVPESTEVLLVSGSTPLPSWDTVIALERLQASGWKRKLAVAFNPFFVMADDRSHEWSRLQQKLTTGLVSKVFLQFGTDLTLARRALDDLRNLRMNVEICASIFLPTKQLLAQQRFRPWKGVFLSDTFFESPREVVVNLIRLYDSYNVELLVEAPGVRRDTDLALVQALLQEARSQNDSPQT